MQINSIVSSSIIQKQQNFKGSSINSAPLSNPQSYQPIPLETSKAYASPKITEGYRKIQTFDVPYVGKGNLYELANGHKIILIPKIGPTVINTYVGVGNLNEPKNIKQASHLLEHLLDNNCSDPRDKNVKDILSKIGASYNATTSDYYTRYYITAPIMNQADLENLIKVQTKTIQNINFTDEDITEEKAIINQELDSRGFFTNNALLADNIVIQNLFNLKKSDDIIAIASPSSIKNIKKADLMDYYNAFYQPNNMVTTIVGSVDANTIKTVAKYIGSMQNHSRQIDEAHYPKISTDNLIQRTIRADFKSLNKDTEMAYMDLAFIGPKSDDIRENMLLDALKYIIRARIKDYAGQDEDKLYFYVYSNPISSDKNCPSLIRVQGVSKNFDTEKNLKTVYSILYDLVQNPVSDKELKNMKDKINSNMSYGKESALLLASIFSEIGALSQDLNELNFVKDVNSFSAKDIQDIAKKYLDLNKAALVVVHPYKTPFDKVKISKDISFSGNVDQLDSKDIHEYLLPNNLRVIIDSRPGIVESTVKVDLHSKKRLYSDPEASAALSTFLPSDETVEYLSKKDIYLDYEANSQEISTTLSGNAAKTLEMLGYSAGILLHPNLSPEKFNKEKEALLQKEKYNSYSVENKNVYKIIGDELLKESPYHYIQGSPKDLTLDDVKMLHKQILKNAQGSVFITLPKENLKDIQGEIFQILMKFPTLQKYDYKTIFNKVDFKPLEKTKIFTETRDDSQIEISQFFKVIESGNIQDRAGLMILNNILGGPGQSLLTEYLRNQDKISYAADSAYIVNKNTGKVSELLLSTTVKASTENLHKVIDEYNKSINELINKPVTQEKIEAAKTSLRSEILSILESSFGKNSLMSAGYNSFYGVNYDEALLDAIDKMTPEYVQALAKYYLTQHYLMAVVGNKNVIESNNAYLATLGEVV